MSTSTMTKPLRSLESGRKLVEDYYDKFGPLPDGVFKQAANSLRSGMLLDDMETALKTGTPIRNFDKYVAYLQRNLAEESEA